MQYLPAELALANLKGEIDPDSRGFDTKERALEELKKETGQDFGWDIPKWEAHVRAMYAHVPKPATQVSSEPDWLDALVHHRRAQKGDEG